MLRELPLVTGGCGPVLAKTHRVTRSPQSMQVTPVWHPWQRLVLPQVECGIAGAGVGALRASLGSWLCLGFKPTQTSLLDFPPVISMPVPPSSKRAHFDWNSFACQGKQEKKILSSKLFIS